MTERLPGIDSILDELGLRAQTGSLVAIGAAATELPGIEKGQVFETLCGPDDLPNTLKAELGIVALPLATMTREKTEQLLSRLRDVHCEKVLVLDTLEQWSPGDLLALGYVEIDNARPDGRCYLFDPDLFNQPREWNNPSDWANPENFRKYRW